MDSDVMHPAGMDKEWNESFYFNFYDRANDLCTFMRIGLKPNLDERTMFCFLMMPDGSVVGKKEQDFFGNGSLEVGSLRFHKMEAEKLWRLDFDGSMARMEEKGPVPVQVKFSLLFESLNDMFDYRECVDKEGEAMSKDVASEHLEQYGRVSGTIMVGDESFEILGFGERDHSWGVRDWNAPKMWIWLTAQFSRSLAFNVTKLFVERGEVVAGFFHMNGRNIPLVKADVRTTLDPDGTPRSLAMSLVDREGGKHKVTAEILREVLMPFPGRDGKSMSVMHETLAEYTFNCQKGYGIAEYLVRRDG